MTAEDIIRVAVTVSLVQVGCDLLARYMIFQKEPYQRAVSTLERRKAQYDKLVKEFEGKTGKQQEKVKKRMDRAKDDLGEAKSAVAAKHTTPGMLTSIAFVLLFRILGTEHSGKVMAVLPFQPLSLMRKVTLRGLDFGGDMGFNIFKESPGVQSVHQACSLMFIYLLCNMGVKFYVHRLVGQQTPEGVGGIMALAENPKIAKGLKEMGLDPDELKQD
ncbi:transmembrane and coiled-coil [Seminavis robusta]|uniref:Transmembrane and coiled-coil n=1 Tax=Seminavis robusta TaxID=568900 RepID=A0A9N8HKR0_9STRA|nr:transmembrane and coiled-coil [Seminavis robusta]|eukprot:Sro858_g211890.1 transmembrane and coiled-coil (217) ;mRNA; f:33808-34458